MNSSTFAQFRSAWMPPAVAQAPIVTRNRHCWRIMLDPLDVVGRRDRPLDQADVVGPGDLLGAGLEEVGDLDRVGDGQQFVLGVQQRELAAVAGGEFEDGQLGFGHAQRSSSVHEGLPAAL